MIKDKFGDRLDGWIHAAFPFLFSRRIDPNLLTMLGTLICCGAAVAFGVGHFALGAVLLALGGFCDLVDGVVARHWQIQTIFGAFLDSTLDRLVDLVVMLGLAIHFAHAGDVATAAIAGVGLTSSILTSYTKARAEALQLPLEGGIFERGERVGLLIAGGLFDLMIPALWILALGSTVTVVQRFQNARRGLEGRERKTEEGAGAEQLVHGK